MPPSRERAIKTMARTVRQCHATLTVVADLAHGDVPLQHRTEQDLERLAAIQRARESLAKAADDLDAIIGDPDASR